MSANTLFHSSLGVRSTRITTVRIYDSCTHEIIYVDLCSKKTTMVFNYRNDMRFHIPNVNATECITGLDELDDRLADFN